MPATRPLVLAAIVNDGALSAWVHRALAEVAALPGVTLALVARRPASAIDRPATTSWLARLVVAADRAWFAPAHPLHGPAPPGALADVPTVEEPEPAGGGVRRLIEDLRIEAVLDLADGSGSGAWPAPLGTWRLQHAGGSAEAAALSSLLHGVSTVRSALQSVEASPRVLAESVSATHHASIAGTLNALLWKNVALVRRGVRRLQQGSATAAPVSRPPGVGPIAGVGAAALARRLPAHARRVIGGRIRRRRHHHRWVLLRGRRDGPDIAGIERLLPPAGHFWADPVIVTDGSEQFVFYEDYRYDLGRGHIAVARVDAAGHLGPSSVALERPYHLSYPSLFQHEGVWYMVPESQANRTIEVYRCERFPDRWQFSHVLMADVRAVDVTFLAHGGRWWMFANVAEFEGSSTHDDLFAFWADHPLSTSWHSHRLNPIVSDVRRARPAGPFIQRDGRLLRPSQDCGSQYGDAICLNEVVTLSDTAYEERGIGRLEASWDPEVVAMHAITEHGDLVFLDGKLRAPRRGTTPPAPRAGRCALTTPLIDV